MKKKYCEYRQKSKSIKALVLTYEKNHALTDHMIKTYNKLWPDHPFIFYVPFQESLNNLSQESKDVIYPVKCSEDITETILTLIKNVSDDEWCYWCMDDKYLVSIKIKAYRKILELIEKPDLIPNNVKAISLCRAGRLYSSAVDEEQRMKLNGIHFVHRINFSQIWLHQFIRGDLLKYLFSHLPSHVSQAKQLDKWKYQIDIPSWADLLVATKSYAIFGESSARGVITKNCYQSMKCYGLDNKLVGKSVSDSISSFWGYPPPLNIRMRKKIRKLLKKVIVGETK